jgi:hypothetical protein
VASVDSEVGFEESGTEEREVVARLLLRSVMVGLGG